MDKKTNKKHAAACRGSVGRQVSDTALLGHREKPRKQGILGQSQF